MKTKEELNAIKEEVEAMNRKLAELTTEELAQITGSREVPDGKGGDYTIPKAYIRERVPRFRKILHLKSSHLPQVADLTNNKNN